MRARGMQHDPRGIVRRCGHDVRMRSDLRRRHVLPGRAQRGLVDGRLDRDGKRHIERAPAFVRGHARRLRIDQPFFARQQLAVAGFVFRLFGGIRRCAYPNARRGRFLPPARRPIRPAPPASPPRQSAAAGSTDRARPRSGSTIRTTTANRARYRRAAGAASIFDRVEPQHGGDLLADDRFRARRALRGVELAPAIVRRRAPHRLRLAPAAPAAARRKAPVRWRAAAPNPPPHK